MEQPSDFVLFLGRFHPLILHLPIGFLVIAFILELLSRFSKKYQSLQPAVGFVLLLGVATTIVAAILGYLLSQGGGYSEDLLALHQWLGISVAVISIVAYVLWLQKEKKASPALDKAYFSIFSLTIIILMAAGHFGGSLTHGSDYLTQYMPNSMRAIAGLPPKDKPLEIYQGNIEEAVVYKDLIHPILESRCNSCHNSQKKKGELEMKTFEAMLKGGENGPALEAGNAAESEMVVRMHLPEDDDDHMPPDGKKQVTEEQIALITWWIDQGAPTDKQVAQLEKSDEINEVLEKLYGGSEADKALYAEEIEPANEQDIKSLQDLGAIVMPLAQNNNWLQVKINQISEENENQLIADLDKLSKQITWLDMGNTSADDQLLKGIASLKSLTRLHLENSEISNDGLQNLKDLENLEYLNIYGTNISDEGLEHLTPLKSLKKLYVWQTKVTHAGVNNLKSSIPELAVDMGIQDSTIQAFSNLKK